MIPALLLFLACPAPPERPVVTGTVTVSADGALSGQFRLTAAAPLKYTLAFPAEAQQRRCGPVETLQITYRDGRPARAADGALFLLGRDAAWLPHPGMFHDMRVWLRLPPGWSGLLSGERPTDAPVCDDQGCLYGPFVGTGQPGAMLVAAPRRIRRAQGAVEVFVAPEHEAALGPLLSTAVAQSSAFEARFGPRATRSLVIFESAVEGGYSVHGVIAFASGAVAAFAEGAREAPLLAHEICHHWFGSIASGHPWLTEGMCRHCELWWVQRTQTSSAAFAETLAEQSDRARPGLTLADMRVRPEVWRDFEAVAYSRGALVHEHWRKAMGEALHDAVLRAHLAAHRGQRAELEQFLAVTASVAKNVDIDALAARWLNKDIDARTGEPRPPRWIVSARLAAGLALILALSSLLLLGWRLRLLTMAWLAGLIFYLWRGPGWVPGGWVVAVAVFWIMLVLAARLLPRTLPQPKITDTPSR